MICSLTAYNRPEYLKQVLDSLDQAIYHCPEPVYLAVSVDHSEIQPEIVDMIRYERGVYWYMQHEKLGLQKNTWSALNAAWDLAHRFKEDFVLHCEDDLVLAPDALRLACWMRDEFRQKPPVGFVGLTQVNYIPDESDYPEVLLSDWFDCHVWGTWRWMWDTYLKPDWPHEWTTHWAARVNDCQMWGSQQVLPKLSRSKSIGEFGTHCGPEAHKVHNPKVYAGDVLTRMPEAYSLDAPVRVS